MRTIERTHVFKRDYKRELRGRFGRELSGLLEVVLRQLAADEPLAFRLRDHALTGDWDGYRDCHLKPDLILIYELVGDDIIRLMRLGSHSELDL